MKRCVQEEKVICINISRKWIISKIEYCPVGSADMPLGNHVINWLAALGGSLDTLFNSCRLLLPLHGRPAGAVIPIAASAATALAFRASYQEGQHHQCSQAWP